MPTIFVESEFAPLRTVVVTQSEVALPALCGHWAPAAESPFTAESDQWQTNWEQEREALVAVLASHGVEVLRPRLLTAQERAAGTAQGFSNFFVRDPFFTVGHVVIEGSLRFWHRRNEILPVRDLLQAQVYASDCVYVAVPRPAWADVADPSGGEGPFLEGGDVLVWGRHVFVGVSGLASNLLGVQWLSKFLTPFGYVVEAVRLSPGVLHLDCALSLVREGLLVVSDHDLLDGLPHALSRWDAIKVSRTDAAKLATNGLPIRPENYILDSQFRELGRALEQRGVQVEYIDYQISRSLGGAFRCSTQALHRSF